MSLYTYFSSGVQHGADALGLEKLAKHAHIFPLSALTWHTLYRISRACFSHAPSESNAGWLRSLRIWYARLSESRRAEWNIRIVSTFHAILCVVFGFKAGKDPALRGDRLYGYSPQISSYYAVSGGYFLWDVVMCFTHWEFHGFQFAFHGIVCLLVAVLSFRPFCNFYGSMFLLYEASTPFLNVSWFLDKCGKKNSISQKIVFITFAVMFFLSRILVGFYLSRGLLSDIMSAYTELPKMFSCFFIFALGGLNILNIYWMSRILTILLFRLGSAPKRAQDAAHKLEGKSESGLVSETAAAAVASEDDAAKSTAVSSATKRQVGRSRRKMQ